MIIFPGGGAEAAPFARFVGERLDDADAQERFLEDLVHIRHAFQQPARRPLHHPADLGQDEQRDRHQDQEHQRQLPADPAGDDHAAMARSGSATTLPKSVFWPVPSISMSLVNRAIISLVPASEKLLGIQMDGPAEKTIAQIEQHAIDDAADQRFLRKLEEALDGDCEQKNPQNEG